MERLKHIFVPTDPIDNFNSKNFWQRTALKHGPGAGEVSQKGSLPFTGVDRRVLLMSLMRKPKSQIDATQRYWFFFRDPTSPEDSSSDHWPLSLARHTAEISSRRRTMGETTPVTKLPCVLTVLFIALFMFLAAAASECATLDALESRLSIPQRQLFPSFCH